MTSATQRPAGLLLPSYKVRDYFPVAKRLPVDIPKGFWNERDWRRARLVRVPLRKVIATQTWLSRGGIRHHSRPNARPDGDDFPWMLEYQDKYYMFDGHHRACIDRYRGKIDIDARVRRVEEFRR